MWSIGEVTECGDNRVGGSWEVAWVTETVGLAEASLTLDDDFGGAREGKESVLTSLMASDDGSLDIGKGEEPRRGEVSSIKWREEGCATHAACVEEVSKVPFATGGGGEFANFQSAAYRAATEAPSD